MHSIRPSLATRRYWRVSAAKPDNRDATCQALLTAVGSQPLCLGSFCEARDRLTAHRVRRQVGDVATARGMTSNIS